MSPLLTWEGTGDVPDFCPGGCGGITEDPYGGPCKACWAAVDASRSRAADDLTALTEELGLYDEGGSR